MKVIIDTNGLMIPVQFNVDIFEELKRLGYDRYIVPLSVIRELESLRKGLKGKDRTAAKVAYSLAQRCDIVETSGHADDVIIDLAAKLCAAVLTNDIGLRNRLEDRSIPIICLRQKNRLEKITDEV
ncbi:DNA-binding protein [Methanolobus halotolerans]|uniref:DNA-binding protein n=1 Tax=Methanolobus halotolerans TaxID=2052935 RepID=A0A4E0Q029_9EURY|nr:DNA-binding protein [Methanolobus halotolerans]TGC11377.1 DNA-binding protein [Methanolobus halotolerans]